MFFLRIIETFERHNIDYALSGGYAAALHGYVQDVREIEFVTENSLVGLIEIQTALEECHLRPEKYSAQSVCSRRENEPCWIFLNPQNPKEKVMIRIDIDINDCKTENKSVYSYKVPIMTLFELQKKLHFQITNTKLINEKSFSLKPHETLQILEDYRTLNEKDTPLARDKSILISVKVPQGLLEQFKDSCKNQNLKYQTQIKQLMKDWLK